MSDIPRNPDNFSNFHETRTRVSSESLTIPSPEHDVNEDNIIDNPKKRVYGVFDGLGGHADGSVASTMAVNNLIQHHLDQISNSNQSLQQVEDSIRRALIDTSNQVGNKARERRNNMATTAVLGHIWQGPNGEAKLVIGNVGDSSGFILRNGQLIQVTLDDGPAKSLGLEGQDARVQEILSRIEDPNDASVTNEERIIFKNRNRISQALGSANIDPHIFVKDLEKGDLVLLTSDGINDNLTGKEIQEILEKYKNNPSIAVTQLIRASSKRSRSDHPRAKLDDMSAVIIKPELNSTGIAENPTQPAIEDITKPVALINNRFNLNDSVRLPLRDGTLAEFTITNYDRLRGNITLQRNTDKGVETIMQRANMVEKYNPPAVIPEIETANNMNELISALSKYAFIQGSEKQYPTEKILEFIKAVEAGNAIALRLITRQGGLRDKVEQLALMEQQPRRILDRLRSFNK